jgi:hypothetical protein
MNGRQVAEAMRERWPTLRVLFITGYAETALPPGIAVIGKPFKLATLARQVQAILAEPRWPARQAEPLGFEGGVTDPGACWCGGGQLQRHESLMRLSALPFRCGARCPRAMPSAVSPIEASARIASGTDESLNCGTVSGRAATGCQFDSGRRRWPSRFW